MLALYRKYRPKRLGDLIGEEHIVEILKNAARNDKLAHAYLFYGPRGTGKTSTARLIAKIANCEIRSTDQKFRAEGEPCNKCRPCQEIDAGRGLDIMEIDAASNRGIDDIRNLKENINLSPTSYRYKVFIIDEVHQLTKDAFNALLKTLEEPPAHAIFILATTEYEKVPATIMSRTQRFHFKKLPIEAIIKKLHGIIKAEKMRVTDEALELIAASAEGGLRDAESLLDQLTSLTDEVTLETVEKTIGKVGFKVVSELAGLILKGDLKASLDYLTSIADGGYNVVDLNKELIHYLRRVLTLKFDGNLEQVFKRELTQRESDQLKKHSQEIKPEKHIPLLKSLIRAYSEMRYSPFAAIPLEIAIIENLK